MLSQFFIPTYPFHPLLLLYLANPLTPILCSPQPQQPVLSNPPPMPPNATTPEMNTTIIGGLGDAPVGNTSYVSTCSDVQGGYNTTIAPDGSVEDFGNAWPWDFISRIPCPESGSCSGAAFTGPSSYQNDTSNVWHQDNITATVTNSVYGSTDTQAALLASIVDYVKNQTISNLIGPCTFKGAFPESVPRLCPPQSMLNTSIYANYVQHIAPGKVTASLENATNFCGAMTVQAIVPHGPPRYYATQ